MSGLYFHIPFCRKKCPYCDFYSLEEWPLPLSLYADLLVRHLEQVKERTAWRGPFETAFFGGGTPSLLAPADVGRILAAVERLFGFSAGAEISLEANPGSVSASSLAGYRAAGINRISFGVQSLREENLRLLGRLHSPSEARKAVAWARKAGFENLGLDLMFGLPGQTVADLLDEAAGFLALEPDHLSTYGLTVEEETPFHHLHRAGHLIPPGEEVAARMYAALHDRLTEEGFAHYEISNFARPGRQCRHNLIYWRRGSCLGLGAGAHSFHEAGWGERSAVLPDVRRYAELLEAERDPAQVLETFDRRGAMAETLYLGLRTSAGVAEAAFRERFGAGVAEAFPGAVRRAGKRLRLEAGSWRFDLSGWLLYDHLIASFLA